MNENRYLRWGILGTSYISEVMAQAIQASAIGQLYAIASRSDSTAKKFSEIFSIPIAYNDYSALLKDPDIDVVYIGLPNHLHKEWIIRAAHAGKHILCEKPLVLNSQEAGEIIDAVKKANVFCMEALMYRCHPLTSKLQEFIQSKQLGEIKLYHAVYTANIAAIANQTAGGSIRNLGCYPVSLIRLLANSNIIEMQAMGRMNETEDTDRQASLMMKFANNAMAVVSTADDFSMSWEFTIYGEKGKLQMITNPWLPGLENEISIQGHDEVEAIILNISAEKPLYTYQIDAVNASILNNDLMQNAISLHDSLENIKVLEKWLQQVKAGAISTA